MAWIARDNDHTLWLYTTKPVRGYNVWTESDEEESFPVELPWDADEDLIGKYLTWEDEPVEI